MATRPKSVRIDSDIWPQLQQRAAQSGVSSSEFMRQAVYEKLGKTEEEATRQEIENLRLELADMRDDMVKMTRILLIIAGSKKVFSEELADQWIAKTFGSKWSASSEGKEAD